MAPDHIRDKGLAHRHAPLRREEPVEGDRDRPAAGKRHQCLQPHDLASHPSRLRSRAETHGGRLAKTSVTNGRLPTKKRLKDKGEQAKPGEQGEQHREGEAWFLSRQDDGDGREALIGRSEFRPRISALSPRPVWSRGRERGPLAGARFAALPQHTRKRSKSPAGRGPRPKDQTGRGEIAFSSIAARACACEGVVL